MKNADQNPANALPELRRLLANAKTAQEKKNIQWLIALAEGNVRKN